MDGSGELGRYSTVTIFPDVKPSHWASAYINMAARKGIISGFADGKFKPSQTVTAGQAVTILMRGLGYKDEDMGGVWPQSYMAEAQTNGLLKSTGITSAYAGLTRAQAARLFLNLFEAKHGKGEALFSYKVGEEVYLTAVDGGQGTMTAGGKSYTMAHPVASTSLIVQGQGGPQQHRRDPDLPAHHPAAMAFPMRRSSSVPTALLPDWILWRAAPATTFTRTVLLPRQQTSKSMTWRPTPPLPIPSLSAIPGCPSTTRTASPLPAAPPPLRCWAARN